MRTLLAIGGDSTLRQEIYKSLRDARVGVSIVFAKTHHEAVGLQDIAEFNGLIVSADSGGLETLKEFRTRGVMLPAIVITAMAKEVVEALLAGTNSLTCIGREDLKDRLPVAVEDVLTIGSEAFERTLKALEDSAQNLQNLQATLQESRLHGNTPGR